MKRSIPRILFAAPSSGSGKTTAVCAVMTLLKRRGLNISSFKCGPDYIDPMFHKAVLGIEGGNLDPFFCSDGLLRSLLFEGAGKDISVIEGVMGYYDGTGAEGMENSTYTVAQETDSPVILIVDAKGAAASLLAVIEGFRSLVSDSRIRGVLFNRISPMTYKMVKGLVEKRFGSSLLPVGFIPKLPENCVLGSRHLGLITAQEIKDISSTLEAVADICESTIDIDGIIRLAGSAPEISCEAINAPALRPITIAAARDDAFCFYYRDTIRLFEKLGARITYFSPLADEPVPAEADGLLIGGGYPELHAEELAVNSVSRESIKSAIQSGMPVIAECGGFQYLGATLDGRKMCGVLPHSSTNTGKLVRFGYINMTASKGGLLGDEGTDLRAHEFHYYDSTENGNAFTAVKPNGRSWECAVMTDTMYAGYPHLYLPSSPFAAEAFYNKCIEYSDKRKQR